MKFIILAFLTFSCASSGSNATFSQKDRDDKTIELLELINSPLCQNLKKYYQCSLSFYPYDDEKREEKTIFIYKK